MYRRVFLRVWKVLSPAAKALLAAMPLAGPGGAPADYLQAITRLPEAEFWPAVGELASRSLLEVRGSVRERRYGIHRLTERFVRLDIIDWRD
jgi:hypothetical protein